MAISNLPPWLETQPFANPMSVLAAGAAAGARDYANQLANRQGQLEAQRTQAQIAQQQAALQQQAQQEANRFAMEQAKFGMQQQAADETAKKEAMRFAGVQGLQAAISGGKKFEEAFPDFAALILGDTGAGMSSLFNSIVGNESREVINTQKLESAGVLQATKLEAKDRETQLKLAADKAIEDERNRTKIAVAKLNARDIIGKLSDADKKTMDSELNELENQWNMPPEIKLQRTDAINKKYAERQTTGGSQIKFTTPSNSLGVEFPTITSKEEFDRLPKGASFVDANGKKFTKPK